MVVGAGCQGPRSPRDRRQTRCSGRSGPSIGTVTPPSTRGRNVKAAIIREPGGPEVLRYEDVPDPVPGPGDVLVRVEAISIEGGDTLARGDTPTGGAVHIVGYQAAGTIIAV